jgi:hypothetical protein
MGNITNPQSYSARERLLFLERLAYWRGWVRRSDLCERFEISVPQASADISAYILRNPGALRYNLNRKRYEAAAKMKPIFGQGTFEEGMRLCADGAASGIDRVARVDLPERCIAETIKQPLVRAVLENKPISIYYFSVHSGTEAWRVVQPHAFAHDGYRWHVRAWCVEDRAYKDFVLGRIAKVRSVDAHGPIPPADHDWNTRVVIRFQAHPSLTQVQRVALERDFGMERGVGTLRVRKALLFYTLVYLGLADELMEQPRRLKLLEKGSD